MKKLIFCLFLLFIATITYPYQRAAKKLNAGMGIFFTSCLNNNCSANIISIIDAVLINFTTNIEDKKVDIQWSTSSETDNSGFIVERSNNAQTWDTLTTVTGKGPTNGISNYQVFDNSPVTGANYYRLVYRSDNMDTASTVRIVSISPIAITGLNIFPDPASYYISFSLAYQGSTFDALLADATGRVIDRETFQVNSSQTYSLKLIPQPGIYILNVNAQGLNKSQRLVVE